MGAHHRDFIVQDDIPRGQAALPLVPRPIVMSSLAQLTETGRIEVLQTGLLPVAILPGHTFYARVEGRPAIDGITIVGHISRLDFDACVEALMARSMADNASQALRRQAPIFSAHRRLTRGQGIVLGGIFWLALLTLPWISKTTMTHVAGFGFAVLFDLLVVLRLLALLVPPKRQSQNLAAIKDEALPVYTILVPLFRETAVLPQLLGAMQQINYPKDKLDLKLILEENDAPMRAAVAAARLPTFAEVLVVPRGHPQTKPRAMNYALHFARGELLTIFDAEDIPLPLQLRIAAAHFAKAPQNVVCLQAELGFFNANENWLSRQFAMEYATLFRLVLPMLSRLELPLPLGGTSNHFRVPALRAAGGWDAHNVTEDADLGFRLSRLGYRTQTIPSLTYEEATTQLGNWIGQRTRWFKGFLQTWLVHMRNPRLLIRDIGFSGFVVLQATTLGVVLTSTVYPLFLLIASWMLVTRPHSIGVDVVTSLYVAHFILGMALMLGCGHVALKSKGLKSWPVVATAPLYWLLAAIPAWLAILQLIKDPFYWNKTQHGLSRLQRAPGA